MRSSLGHKLGALLRPAGLDALVCLSPENIAYSAGFVIPSQPLMRWRHAAHIITADGREALVCVDMEETTVRALRPDVELHVWKEFGGNAMATLAEALRALGLDNATIGTELRYLPALDRDELLCAAPHVKLVAADSLLSDTRRIKDSDELDLLGRLSRISDQAIRTALGSVRAGDTEMDIAAALVRSVYEQGAQAFKLMIVATGERSELPNVGPSERVLTDGDICRVEIFSVIDGYQAGVCRTGVVGTPSAEATRIYRNLSDCKRIVIDSLRPGVRAHDVYRAYRAKFDVLGLPPISFVGHGIGTDLHEPPYLSDTDDTRLEEGMVFGIEPLVYRTGHGFGMQIKDMVAITADGCELLSDVTDTTELLVVSP